MIVLERTIPDDLVGYRFLARRFPTNMEFIEKYRNLSAGLVGELLVDREMDELLINEDYFLFQNYEAKTNAQKTIQIDTLYISRKFILTLEVKNIAGRVRFDQMQHQFIRTKDSGEISGFTNPINQVIRHQQWLQQQLYLIKLQMPIISAVIFTNPSTIISSPPSHIPVFHLNGLRYEFPKWNASYKEHITDFQLQKLKSHLLHQYFRRPFYMPIDNEAIQKNVLCPSCQKSLTFNRDFQCNSCQISTNFVDEVLNEYRVIWGSSISVKELKNYFLFNSSKSAYRFLKFKGFQKINKGNLTRYVIPFNIESPVFEKMVDQMKQ